MTTINESFIVNKDTTDFNNNSIIKKGTIVKGAFSGVMPNGEIRITTDKGQIINLKDLQSQNQPVVAIPQFKTPTQQEPVSDLEYYTSANFLKRASVSIVPVGLIGAYCYHKKFSLLKSALLISIPIVAITILQNIGMGGGKNAYWSIFAPPSIRANKNAKLRQLEKSTGMPQKMV